jgi:hypothetical protein
MTDNFELDPRHGGSRGHRWRIQRARPAGEPSDDIRHLSLREERDLHFKGDSRYDMRPLHELCSPGGCRYKTEAENCADLEAWFSCKDRDAGREDPEAEL